jgi:hypothetical protein
MMICDEMRVVDDVRLLLEMNRKNNNRKRYQWNNAERRKIREFIRNPISFELQMADLVSFVNLLHSSHANCYPRMCLTTRFCLFMQLIENMKENPQGVSNCGQGSQVNRQAEYSDRDNVPEA